MCYTALLIGCPTGLLPMAQMAQSLTAVLLSVLLFFSHCLTASLPRCTIASLYHCLTASLPRCTIASLYHCRTASLFYNLTGVTLTPPPVPLPYCLTLHCLNFPAAAQPRRLTAPIHHSLTVLLPHCFTTP
jgi:hypothetical protein